MSTTYNGVIYEYLSVDVCQTNEFAPRLVKQKDAYTRGYIITLTENGEPLTIPTSSTTAWLNCRNQTDPTKRASVTGTINNDGTVTVIVPATVMEVAGYIQCDISIITVSGEDTNILKSTLFYLDCQAAANPEGTTSTAEDSILAGIAAGTIVPPGRFEKVVEVSGNDLDSADKNDTLYIHKVGSRVKGLVIVAGDDPAYQGCTQYRFRKSGSVEYRIGALDTTTTPYSYNWGSYTATGDWIRLARKDEIPDVSSPWKNKTYISHGDSITWQDGRAYGGTSTIARGYQTVLTEMLELGTKTNSGVNGATLADRIGISASGVGTIKAVASYSNYDLCTIAFGTNDFKQGVPLGELGVIGDTGFDTATFFGAYREAVEYILTSSPSIRLVLMTPMQRDQHNYDVNTVNSAGFRLIDYVKATKLIGKMYGLPVCDLYSNSGITKLTLNTYTLDGLHPNDVGYARIAEVLSESLTTGGNNDVSADKMDLAPTDPTAQEISNMSNGQLYGDTVNHKVKIKGGQEFYDTTYIDSMVGDIETLLSEV